MIFVCMIRDHNLEDIFIFMCINPLFIYKAIIIWLLCLLLSLYLSPSLFLSMHISVSPYICLLFFQIFLFLCNTLNFCIFYLLCHPLYLYLSVYLSSIFVSFTMFLPLMCLPLSSLSLFSQALPLSIALSLCVFLFPWFFRVAGPSSVSF